jgi:hypothetical protein
MFNGEMENGRQEETAAGEVEAAQPRGEEVVTEEAVNNEETVVGVEPADMELERLSGHEKDKEEEEEEEALETETAFVEGGDNPDSNGKGRLRKQVSYFIHNSPSSDYLLYTL